MSQQQTIDKVSFRINIPIAISMVVATAIFISGYYQLEAQITTANVGIASILEKVSASNAAVSDLTKKVDDLNNRVTRLEARVK